MTTARRQHRTILLQHLTVCISLRSAFFDQQLINLCLNFLGTRTHIEEHIEISLALLSQCLSHAHTHSHISTNFSRTRTRALIYIEHTHTYSRTHTHKHTHTHKLTDTHTHTHMFAHTHTHTHTCMHTHTNMNTLAGDGVFVIREAATKNLAALASLFGPKRTY
jgi:hypothetical protein